MGLRPALIVPTHRADDARSWALERGLLDTSFHPLSLDGEVAWPLTDAIQCDIGRIEKMEFQPRMAIDPHTRLQQALPNMKTPRRWEILDDLVLLPQDALLDGDESTWIAVAQALHCQRVARQAEIESGPKRRSQVEMLLGNYGWVNHLENGVRYLFDVTKVMFSSGNITERRRMGNTDSAGDIVVDMFAGIGYYSIPLLVNAGVSYVHACEMNPDSIEGLTKGLSANKVAERCRILRGDNQDTAPLLKGVADRVLLGLLPSSKEAWPLAVECLKIEGGVIHVHMNATEESLEDGTFVSTTVEEFEALGCKVEVLHLEDVKSYSPHIRHVVLDLKVTKL
ncbi:MAG: class I SAM-dependent methyltransferase family protein [Candidatus Poseidoniaceae archaeon]|jgi:tRNA G37 N-methylase Trm5|nr:class I SAM-dependent methyltransferase family protein [Candidatus Poseidoniaceae archaeon]